MARVLIIEDNDANMELMVYLLQALGHSICSADDGFSGLAAFTRDRFDLVVCDVELPAVDGIELVGRMKADAATCEVPVVAVTARAMAGDRERLLQAGFDGYIAKPIDPETFVGTLEKYLRQPASHATKLG
jgi:CheY-like chemotaxis protein